MKFKKSKYFDDYVTPFFKVQKTRDLSKENNEPFYRLIGNDSVICCLIDKSGDLILVEQFRKNLNKLTLEFPAGEIEKGENPEKAMRREIAEETGMSCDLIGLGKYRMLLNRETNYYHVFLGFNANLIKGENLESGIRIKTIKRQDFKKMILKNDNFEQLAALGIIYLADKHLDLQLLDNSWVVISDILFKKR